MNTDENITPDSRPFGFWITAVDRLLRAEFATVFDDEAVTRRDWRMLNLIDGTVASDRPLRAPKLRRLIALGWIERTRDGWTLTEAGRLAKQRLGVSVQEIRDRVAGAVSPDEFTTMTAALEKIARELGWEEGRKLPRRGRRHGEHGRHGGHGRRERHHGFRHGFGREGRHESRHGFEHEYRHEGGHGSRHDREHDGRHDREHGHRGFRGHGAPAPHIHIHTHG
ncbi:MarR family winged helix-turn-helix transcriptional regulator [Microbacterium sp. NPDC058345]|uniref:MarR family winged helix-turn-helix transcriptional regulator n=1 Tax=Microbacterium sp. NPDC058345 TaxID=3346455 RepID=UPI00365328E7